MKGFKRLGKMLAVGSLALAISAPAATAAAAPVYSNVQYKVIYTQGSNGDINALIQQYLQQLQSQYPQYRWTYQPVVQQPAASKPVVSKPVVTKPATQPVKAKPATQPANTGSTAKVSNFAAAVFNLVNQERAKAGLSALKLDSALSNMAMVKAQDMKNNNYFDHNSPTYGSPFDMMKKFGISYRAAGENIAMGQRSPQEVMTAWMNSPGHKANILGQNFTKIGVAYYNGEWVQEFTG